MSLLGNKRKIQGNQMPFVMDHKGANEGATPGSWKRLFCKVCGILVWLGITVIPVAEACTSGG